MPSRALALSLLAVAPAACGGPGAPVRARVTAGRGDGIRYVVPAGWHIARHSLTPHLVDPREVLTAGTGPLPSGGACAQNPGAALAAMGPRDVLVTVRERYRPVAGVTPRPRRFTLPPAVRSEAQECAGRGASFATRLVSFRTAGRDFDVIVAVGRKASRARLRQALAILNSLRVRPRRGREAEVAPFTCAQLAEISAHAHARAASVRACPAAPSPPSCSSPSCRPPRPPARGHVSYE
jgi:hypothetical protein